MIGSGPLYLLATSCYANPYHHKLDTALLFDPTVQAPNILVSYTTSNFPSQHIRTRRPKALSKAYVLPACPKAPTSSIKTNVVFLIRQLGW